MLQPHCGATDDQEALAAIVMAGLMNNNSTQRGLSCRKQWSMQHVLRCQGHLTEVRFFYRYLHD